MKKIFFLILLIFGLKSTFAQENVLFIGNSLTYFNGMPQMFRELAESKEKNVFVDSFTIGGAGLSTLSTNAQLHAKINSKAWDIVIIQPGTNESGGNVSTAQTAQHAQVIINLVKNKNSCARFYIYEISNGIPAINNVPNFEHYFQTQTQIKNKITELANLLQIPYIPVGEVFRKHYTDMPQLLLHPTYNDVHPNYLGSYLIASSIYTALYTEPVFPSNYVPFEQFQADYLQNLASTVVLESVNEWRIGTVQPFVYFTTSVNNAVVSVQNFSANYDSLSWLVNTEIYNLVDNSLVFNSLGEKEITLIATKGNCDYYFSKKIEIVALSNKNVEIEDFSVYPNPVKNRLFIKKWEEIQSMEIVDLSGKILKNIEIISDSVDVSFLESGVYIFIFRSKTGGKFSQKIYIK